MTPDGSGRSKPRGESDLRIDDSAISGSLTMHEIPAGAEDHVCVLLELPNDVPVWSRRARTTLTPGSHHFTLYKEPSTTAIQDVPASCSPMVDGVMFAGTQQAVSDVTLPVGIGHRYEPHQHLYVQLHYINTTSAPIDVSGTFELQRSDEGEQTLAEARSVLLPTLDISVPPRSPGSARLYVTPTAPEPNKVRHVFGIASHTHRLGVRTTIERVSGLDAPGTEPIYESFDWESPDLAIFDPPLVFSRPDGLRLICNYMNTTDQVVHWGTSANDEMCVLAVMYYDE